MNIQLTIISLFKSLSCLISIYYHIAIQFRSYRKMWSLLFTIISRKPSGIEIVLQFYQCSCVLILWLGEFVSVALISVFAVSWLYGMISAVRLCPDSMESSVQCGCVLTLWIHHGSVAVSWFNGIICAAWLCLDSMDLWLQCSCVLMLWIQQCSFVLKWFCGSSSVVLVWLCHFIESMDPTVQLCLVSMDQAAHLSLCLTWLYVFISAAVSVHSVNPAVHLSLCFLWLYASISADVSWFYGSSNATVSVSWLHESLKQRISVCVLFDSMDPADQLCPLTLWI